MDRSFHKTRLQRVAGDLGDDGVQLQAQYESTPLVVANRDKGDRSGSSFPVPIAFSFETLTK